MSWPLVKLGDLVTIKGGGTPSKKVDEYWNGDIPWASVKDLKSNEISSTADFITEAGVKNSATNLISAGTILTATRMALGKFAINAVDMAINQDLKALFINAPSVVERNYLIRFLSSKARYIEGEGKGATVKGITLDFLKDLQVPLPPLDEQKRIAAILDKADSVRRKRQQAIDLADDFLRSVFLDMFGDPVTNPKGWDVKPIQSGLKEIKSGWSAKAESYPCKEDELGVLKISAVTSGVFKPLENKFVKSELTEGKKLVFPSKGDLLFSRANTRELVAATCIVTESRNDVFLPDKLWKIKTDTKLLLPEFLHYLIQHPKFKDILTSQATGTSGSMLNISKAKFENSLGIIPPIEMQNKFKDLFWKVDLLNNSVAKSLNRMADNFNSLSQKTFSGKL
ncbi:restriction endonuclease subunit S [Pseudoalteromonas sp. NEC-BIFX-2020_015]|uniref:restriction endonuclease subunit S n=1 Tax=Pseudoalteromonas sp. NEC-BIFX-2020_015 TaxID=2729544 RepID=UPI00146159D5|nr:restriction endonuclease subunit S [Pseudoalteromonas sp. NEC-BIFX-2020_015]